MTTTLITGATGFIGSHVCRLLVERGDDVVAAVRAGTDASELERLGVRVRTADVRDRRAVRRVIQGADRVFHCAGARRYAATRAEAFAVHVEGSRIVLEEALRADVERVVYTSSVAAVGPPQQGRTADETNSWYPGRFRVPYLIAKHEAEVMALRLAARGLPVVIVNPAMVFGAGDPARSSTAFVRRFLRREISMYTDGTVNVVGVEDVARGHLAADQRGTIGERYILGNRNFTVDRLLADLGRISGVEPPRVKVPTAALLAAAQLGERVPLPGVPAAADVWIWSQRWAFTSRKAKRDLRWETSPHEDCLEDTVAYYRSLDGAALAPIGARQPLPLRVAGGLLGTVYRRTPMV